ncbi:MAG TPA: hypothetical protein VK524_17075, partial [Polyangiaceae bacterium]|nr:hypothetical protein [Polyangiaceae bacterium]
MASVFASILKRLCESTGGYAAALVDGEGETVDYFARDLDPFGVRVSAAEWRLVLATLQQSRIPGWADAGLVLVRAQNASFGLVPLAEGYALIVHLPRHGFRISERALAVATEELAAEAGLRPLEPVAKAERWVRVRVQTVAGNPRRPLA